MKTKTASRGTDIDLEKCVSMTGNNRYNLVLMAAARARELVSIQRQRDWATHVNAPVQALLDVQQGLVGPEYLRKVR
jgi:DNA-directed RNA polymerase subunit K/omega